MKQLESIILSPMSAGDIIDRAIRLYRHNFIALLRIVLPPSLIAYSGSIVYYLGMRNFSLERGDLRLAMTALMVVGGWALWLIGNIFFYAVLGAASKSLVNHYFDGTPIRPMEVYRGLRERFWSLAAATMLVILLGFGTLMLIYFLVVAGVLLFTFAATQVGRHLPNWAQVISTTIFAAALAGAVATMLLMLYSRIIYVPQVLMVEGKSAALSISRSFAMAGGEARKIAAIVLFWFYVAWSLWFLLMVPLGWYGYWAGVDITPFGPEAPFWYSVSQQTITQLSAILVAPVAMLAFTLLYIDSRVRKEGFDVELVANRVLSAPNYLAPDFKWLPAVSNGTAPAGAPEAGSGEGAAGLRAEPPEAAEEYSEPASPDYATEIDSSPALTAVDIHYTPGEADPAGYAGTVPVPPPPAKPPVKSCRWCGTNAEDDDRFCRVCGSLF